MPHINEIKNSKFLKKEDVGDGVRVTIAGCSEENVAKEGATPEMKWALHFHELDKPMVLNSTNAQLIAKITGSEDTDGWKGHKVELYEDPSITFGGKLIGGIRVRKATGGTKAPPEKPAPSMSFDDAVRECLAANITKPELIDKLKAAGRKGWQPSRDTPFVRQLIEDARNKETSFGDEPPPGRADDEIPF